MLQSLPRRHYEMPTKFCNRTGGSPSLINASRAGQVRHKAMFPATMTARVAGNTFDLAANKKYRRHQTGCPIGTAVK